MLQPKKAIDACCSMPRYTCQIISQKINSECLDITTDLKKSYWKYVGKFHKGYRKLMNELQRYEQKKLKKTQTVNKSMIICGVTAIFYETYLGIFQFLIWPLIDFVIQRQL